MSDKRKRDLNFVTYLRSLQSFAARGGDPRSARYFELLVDKIHQAIGSRTCSVEDVLYAVGNAQQAGSVLDTLGELDERFEEIASIPTPQVGKTRKNGSRWPL